MKANQELKDLRRSLNELHKLMLGLLKKERERVAGKVMQPSEWFQTLLAAPDLAWVRPLNSLLSDVDALSEAEEAGPQDLAVLYYELERFFFKEDDDVTSFNSHYRKLFTNSPDLVFAHGQLRQAYSKLPVPTGPVPMNAEELRRSWHRIGASKRKLLN